MQQRAWCPLMEWEQGRRHRGQVGCSWKIPRRHCIAALNSWGCIVRKRFLLGMARSHAPAMGVEAFTTWALRSTPAVWDRNELEWSCWSMRRERAHWRVVSRPRPLYGTPGCGLSAQRVSIGVRSRFRRSPGSPGPRGSSDKATSASSSSDSERAAAKGSEGGACTGAGDTDSGRTGR